MIKKSIKKSPKKVYSPDFSKKKTVNIPLGMATTEYNEPNMPPLAFNPFVNIVGQTLLDQNDFGKGFNFSQSYSESLNNPNTPNDINTALELVKLNVPIVGDLVVNSLQEGISANTNKNRLRYGLPGNASQGPTKKALGGNNWFAPMVAPQFSLYGQFGQDTNQGMLQVPQYENKSKEYNLNIDATKYSMISPIVSSALQGISGLSKSAPNKQNFNFYNQRASQNSINTDLYSTKQDLYGNQYFDRGGELKSLQSQYDSRNKSIAALQMLGDEDNDIVEALSYSNSLLSPKINKLQEAKTLEEIADYQQKLEEQSKLISQQSNQQAFYNYTPYRDTEDTQMFIDDDGEYNSSYVPSPNIGFNKNVNVGDNAKYAYKYFQQKGVAPHIAAGIVGNFTQESNVNPNITNSLGAFGAGQWLGPRKKALFNFAKNTGRKPNSLDTQLDFTLYELQTTEANANKALSKAKTPEEAAYIFRKKYERSGEHEANDKRRINTAQSLYYNKFKQGGTMTRYNYGGMIQQLQQYQKGGSKQNPPRLKQPKNKTSKFI
jgi:hypothetical protein